MTKQQLFRERRYFHVFDNDTWMRSAVSNASTKREQRRSGTSAAKVDIHIGACIFYLLIIFFIGRWRENNVTFLTWYCVTCDVCWPTISDNLPCHPVLCQSYRTLSVALMLSVCPHHTLWRIWRTQWCIWIVGFIQTSGPSGTHPDSPDRGRSVRDGPEVLDVSQCSLRLFDWWLVSPG